MNPLSMLSRGWRRLRHLFKRTSSELDMADEMRLHIELEVEDRVRCGMSVDEARRTALRDFGGVERHKEDARSARGVRPIEDLVQDSQYAMRVLRKSPGFTVASILTVAIGIAATTTVFSAVNAILLRPPPVADVARLFVVAELWKNGQRSYETNMAQYMYRYAHMRELRDASTSVFSGLAGYRFVAASLRTGNSARAIARMAVSSNYFRVLGIQPALGVLLVDTVDRPGATNSEVVISHDLWQSEFAGDSGVIGRTLYVDSHAVTVSGVAPKGFNGTTVGLAADLWTPVTDGTVTMFGRLRSGVSVKQALAALKVIAPNLPSNAEGEKVVRVTLDPMHAVPAMARGTAIGFLGMLFLTATFVLLIVAANIAGMFLARASHRSREIAVRLALGAARGRIVRQLLTESVALCLMGGALGVLLSFWLVSLVPSMQLPLDIRTALDLRLDGLVLAVAFAATLAAGVTAGLTPALRSTRVDIISGLRSTDPSQSTRLARSRSVFVTAQLAVSLVLLLTAGLFTRALDRAVNTDRGLDANGVFVAELSVRSHGYDEAKGRAFYAQLFARLAARPEVQSAALGQWTPLSMSHNGEGVRGADGRNVQVTWGIASQGFAQTVRIPIVAGRFFDARETQNSQATVVVNETLARRMWPGQSAIGQQFKLGGTREVIGVVRDGKYRGLDESPTAYAFIPTEQQYSPRQTIHVRARGDINLTIAAVRTEVAALDPNIALEKVGLLAEQIDIYTTPQRFAAWCIGAFGMLGLGLASLGVYGAIAYTVSQRTRELGIRLALGARKTDIMVAVLTPALRSVGLAIVIGIPVAMGLARVIAQFLFGVGATDLLTFTLVPVLLSAAALLASYVPARRAARLDPMKSLRAD